MIGTKIRTLSDEKENNIRIIKSLYVIEEVGPRCEYYVEDEKGAHLSIPLYYYSILTSDESTKNFVHKNYTENVVTSRSVYKTIQIEIERDDKIDKFQVENSKFEYRLNDLSESTLSAIVIRKDINHVINSKVYKFPKFINDFRKVEALEVLKNLYNYLLETVNFRTQDVVITITSDSYVGQRKADIKFFNYYGVYGIGEKGVLLHG